jgi:Uroporphyrinogen decarboxylase (URO-D)
MTSKERVKESLNHKQTDKVVVDFGSTSVTGIHILAVEKLRNYYGLEKKIVKVLEPYQMLGDLDEELISVLGIDTIGVFPKNTMFGFPNEGWKEFKTFWGQEVLVPGNFNTSFDGNGDLLIYPEGDFGAPPSGRMPKASYFFDSIIRQETFDENNLDPMDNVEEFKPFSEDELAYFEAEINAACDSGKAVVVNIGGTGLGDIALVPAPFLKHPRGIRDITEWYMSTVMRMEYIQTIFEMQTDIALLNLKKLYQRVGNKIDVLFLCGTDFGTQDSQFCAPESFHELYQPYYKKMTGWIHKNTSWKIFKHSCGAVEPLIENFIESGFDILNPVQIAASGMDSKNLKSKYGDKLTFWGGGVDTQNVLSFGTTREVEKQVLEQCKILSENGGFVFNAVHNIQANVPVDNIVAMFNALKKFNGN